MEYEASLSFPVLLFGIIKPQLPLGILRRSIETDSCANVIFLGHTFRTTALHLRWHANTVAIFECKTPKNKKIGFLLEENGGRRGIRTPDQRCVKPLRYHCAIRPAIQLRQ